MRITHLFTSASVLALVAACGAPGNKDKSEEPTAQQQPEVSDAEKANLEQEYAKVPNAAIVRVPVDANGETIGAPEMRVYTGAETMENAESLTAAFEAGAAPQKVVSSKDELDADSSVQSWQSYEGYDQSYGGGYGGGHGGSFSSTNHCRPRCGSWGHNYWYSGYKPVLYWRGYGWNYGHYRPTFYIRSGYRYYCYRTHRWW